MILKNQTTDYGEANQRHRQYKKKKARDLDEEDDALLEAAEKEFREAREKQQESSAQKTAEIEEPAEKNDANEELISG